MIERLIGFALTQRVFVLVLVASLLGFGGYALSNLPIEAFPDVQDVQVRVISQSSGQAPQDMERAVTLPIEREVSGIPHLINARSVTMTGLSIITLTFADGTDDYFARQQVAEKLAKKESAFDYTAYVGGVLLVIALVFVWRSFYSMRIPKK